MERDDIGLKKQSLEKIICPIIEAREQTNPFLKINFIFNLLGKCMQHDTKRCTYHEQIQSGLHLPIIFSSFS